MPYISCKSWRLPSTRRSWTSGVQVPENINELWSVLTENGIDVWVCSASSTDAIRAAVDVWGLREYCSGVIAMTNTLVEGVYDNAYDYATGCAWKVTDGEWVRDTVATEAQTQGVGKRIAVQNVLVSRYGNGPIAEFMDSTGDFNFCTEFDSLRLVVCFNRANRRVTDGGGLIAVVAVYEQDVLGYDLTSANEAGDVLYVLQGRDENGLRTLIPGRETLRRGKDSALLWRDGAEGDMQALYNYVSAKKLSVADIINTFAIKTSAGDGNEPLGFDCGFLSEYDGYKNVR